MKKYLPFLLLDIKSIRRIYLLFEIIFWPIIGVASFGLFTIFTNVPQYVKMFLFTGTIGWSMIQICQHAIARGFMIEVWQRSLKQTFSSPITLRSFVMGHTIYATVATFASFIMMALTALFLFNFNLFNLGFYIPLIIGLAILCGLVLGIISISVVLLFGLRVDFIVWSLVNIVVFISGVYYSVIIFPQPVQIISYSFPAIYVFEGMRNILSASSPFQTLIQGYFIAFIWAAFLLLWTKRIDNHARKIGFYQRYG